MLDRKIVLSRALYSTMMRVIMLLAALITFSLAVSLITYIIYKGYPNLSLEFITAKPSYLNGTSGILPDILSTVYILLTTILLILPLGAGCAIYLNEYAENRFFVGIVEFAAETLSGIPSIIFGLAGMLIFCQFFGMKTSLLAGSLTLAVMNLPTMIRSAQESLKTVPNAYREGAYALGARKFHVIRTVVLPGCVDGILAGCILSIGKILGESAALLFTAGFSHSVYGFADSLRNPGSTLAVSLYVYAKEQGEFAIAFAIAAILVVLATGINFSALAVGRFFRHGKDA